jgi:hypothetical protein
MKLRALGLGVAVAAGMTALSMGFASAAFINGTLSIRGNDIIDYAGDNITFVTGTTTVGAATGSFGAQGFILNNSVEMRNEGTAISYTSPALSLGSNLTCGTGCIFTATSGTGNIATFNIVGNYTVTEDPGVSLNILATGFAFLTGFDLTPGTFFFSSQGPEGPTVTFSATVVAVPGPIVGAGLPGLIAACAGLIGLARRRRRKVA